MGTTLTGTTPQDTYDSLIKVTDNGPLSGTAKYLSDGLGNDSILALSTTALGIGTASPTSLAQLNGTAGTAHLRVSEAGATIGFLGGANGIISGATGSMALRAEAGLILSSQGNAQTMTLTATGNVGIGVTPSAGGLGGYSLLEIANGGASIYSGTNQCLLGSNISWSGGTASYKISNFSTLYNQQSGIHSFSTAASGTAAAPITFVESVKIDSDGLKFNGDTAAANALDDYEEGTWTMGVSFGGAAAGVAYVLNTGRYTKIGRQVTATGFISLSSKGSSTGNARITGLPFTIGADIGNYSAPSFGYINAITFADTFHGYGEISTTTILLEETTNAGVKTNILDSDFANNSEFMVSFTYFV
jgi:hypothetical protein